MSIGAGGLADIAQIAKAAGDKLIKLGEEVASGINISGMTQPIVNDETPAGDNQGGKKKPDETFSEKLKNIFKDTGEKFENIFKDFGGNFKDLLGGLTKDLGGLFKGLLGDLGGLFGGEAGLGGLLGGITKLFGFAGGGRVQPGVPAVVGERGPELIIPSRSGTVMNAADSRSAARGRSVAVNQTVNFDLVPGPTISAMIDAKKPEIERAAIEGTLKAMNRGAM